MEIIRTGGSLSPEQRQAVVALGNFDGVHRGHQALIAAARAIADEKSSPLAVASFEPHPRSFFQPDLPPFRLTMLKEKARRLAACSVDRLYVIPFDEPFSKLSPEAFAQRLLVASLGIRHVVVGPNFRYGHERKGDVETLQASGSRFGFGVTAIEATNGPDGAPLSSTSVRKFLADARPEAAAAILGQPWEIEEKVSEGDKRGRQIGFPTANIELGSRQQPGLGVYAVQVGVPSGNSHDWHKGVANFGIRPTVDGRTPRLEVHLFDFSGDLYDIPLRVRLMHHIRPEKKFDGLPALKKQIAEDAKMAREMLARTPLPGA